MPQARRVLGENSPMQVPAVIQPGVSMGAVQPQQHRAPLSVTRDLGTPRCPLPAPGHPAASAWAQPQRLFQEPPTFNNRFCCYLNTS